MNQNKVLKAVEYICGLGCEKVNDIISRMEQGEDIEQVKDLDKGEQENLLNELKIIMDVYNKEL
jgi:hypothetical protein